MATIEKANAAQEWQEPAHAAPAETLSTGTPVHSTVVVPHPKRFSAVNINKKFLEKNSSATPSSSTPPLKSTVSRPTVQPSGSHSRLVTTKLTSNPQLSPTTGPGWSRPSSAAPPATGVPTSQTPPIQSKASKPSKKDPNNKPVWANIRGNGPQSHDMTVKNDFPTAAEVAQVETSIRQAKLVDSQEAAESAAATKQARAEEADTFRGVHLDPNAHHWDDMEEDDDNFLDGVIEFGDGRQYKVESTDQMPLLAATTSSLPEPVPEAEPEPIQQPVSKEDRFADDFDRSWPRSKPSPTISTNDITPVPPSPAISLKALHSPHDSSRVLFNERSNRLEPYSNSTNNAVSHRQPSKNTSPPTEPRAIREAAPSPTSIQLLQKSGSAATSEFPSRPRGLSGASAHTNDRRESFRRDPAPTNARIPDSAKVPALGERGRRLSSMGPPPLPLHAARANSKETTRQLPPHLSQSPVIPRRLPSRDSRPSPSAWGNPSPVLSHTSAASVASASPPHSAKASLPLPNPAAIPDEVRKDLMLSAAARAKQRRQQEEEEREKEKERARKKAAELEAKFKEQEAEKMKAKLVEEKLTTAQNDQAVAFIEEVAQSVREPLHSPEETSNSDKLPLRGSRVIRPPPEPRLSFARRPSTSSTTFSATSPLIPTTPTVQAESWRTKTNPSLPHMSPVLNTKVKLALPAFVAPTALSPVDRLAENTDEQLEVIDFAELGKFVGAPDDPAVETVPESVPESSKIDTGSSSGVRPPRPLASDFFDDRPSLIPSKSDVTTTWRRTRDDPPATPTEPGREETAILSPRLSKQRQSAANTETASVVLSTPKKASIDHADTTPVQILAAPPNGQQRTPRTPNFYAEARISALNDTMSRIKGAIDGMQSADNNRDRNLSEHSFSSPSRSSYLLSSRRPMKDRWMSPAMRAAQTYDLETEQIPREKQVTGCEPPRSPKPAWNCLIRLPSSSSELEPVSKQQLHFFNLAPASARWDILSFDPPVEGMNKRDLSINDVLFRRQNGFKGKHKNKVLLPRKKAIPNLSVNVPDTAGTWRKSLINTETVLSTTSPSSLTQAETTSDEHAPLPRSKPQPKMPAGSAVAFYRDSRIHFEAAPVKFIVNSELEGTSVNHIVPPEINITDEPVMVSASTSSALKEVPAESKPENKSSDNSAERRLPTPPLLATSSSSSSTWGIPLKEPPARGPDPEHLKAVWSQPSDKARTVPTVNSLQGIADDLTALPFTLQDVKSEDGETPPGTSTSFGPSRMSLHDVTRAFQQVPSSSTANLHSRTVASPPYTTYPNVRPGYAYPMPSSPMVYPPSRMHVSGHAPMYGQPAVWMSPGGPPNANGVMRPLYPNPIMSYPQSQPGMYNQHNQSNRGRPVSMISPHMYPGSPVLMHAPAMHMQPPNGGYLPINPGRGQGRNDQNGHRASGYTSHTPTSFVHPTW